MKLHPYSAPSQERVIYVGDQRQGRFELWRIKQRKRESLACIEYTFHTVHKRVTLTWVTVQRDFRKRGIGSAMMDRFLRSQRRRGRRLFYLVPAPIGEEGVDTMNRDQLVRWYESRGFVQSDDNCYMVLRLK